MQYEQVWTKWNLKYEIMVSNFFVNKAIKSKMAIVKRRCFSVLFFVLKWTLCFTSFSVRGLQWPWILRKCKSEINIDLRGKWISVLNISTQSILLTILLLIDCSKMANIGINTRSHNKLHLREITRDKFVICNFRRWELDW